MDGHPPSTATRYPDSTANTKYWCHRQTPSVIQKKGLQLEDSSRHQAWCGHWSQPRISQGRIWLDLKNNIRIPLADILWSLTSTLSLTSLTVSRLLSSIKDPRILQPLSLFSRPMFQTISYENGWHFQARLKRATLKTSCNSYNQDDEHDCPKENFHS